LIHIVIVVVLIFFSVCFSWFTQFFFSFQNNNNFDSILAPDAAMAQDTLLQSQAFKRTCVIQLQGMLLALFCFLS
jgi:hypothetical protein